MSRYYFDIVAGESVVADNEGTELSSPDAARSEAISDARHLMSHAVLRGEDVSHKIVRVRDDAGDIVFSIPFADAIRRPTP